MPVTKSAIKKLRQDTKRTLENNLFKQKLELLIRKAEKASTAKNIAEAYSIIDKSVKKNLMHENKSNRLKSKLSKLIDKKVSKTSTKVAVAKKPSTRRSKVKSLTNQPSI